MEFPPEVAKNCASRAEFVQANHSPPVQKSEKAGDVGSAPVMGFCTTLSLAWCRLVLGSTTGPGKVPEAPAERIKRLTIEANSLYLTHAAFVASIPRIDVEGLDKKALEKAVGEHTFKVGNVYRLKAFADLVKMCKVKLKSAQDFKSMRLGSDADAQTFLNNIPRMSACMLTLEWAAAPHYIAVFRTAGTSSTDDYYYFFDPNCGEFLCTTGVKAGVALHHLLGCYSYTGLRLDEISVR